jgi:hypothetical protein
VKPQDHNDLEREERLNAILASWLEAAESGQVPDEQEFVARYPEFAQELSQHLATWKRFAPIGALPSHYRGVHTPRSPEVGSVSGVSYDTGNAEPPEPASGDFSFAGYELLEIISQGGMGVVYKARQKNPNRLVALKMIRPGRLMTAEDVQRFRNEAELVAQLDHPNLVHV